MTSKSIEHIFCELFELYGIGLKEARHFSKCEANLGEIILKSSRKKEQQLFLIKGLFPERTIFVDLDELHLWKSDAHRKNQLKIVWSSLPGSIQSSFNKAEMLNLMADICGRLVETWSNGFGMTTLDNKYHRSYIFIVVGGTISSTHRLTILSQN